MKKHFSNSSQGAIDHFASCAVEFTLPCLLPSDLRRRLVPMGALRRLPRGHILFRRPFLIHCKRRHNASDWCVGEKVRRHGAASPRPALFNGSSSSRSVKEHHFAPRALSHKQFLVLIRTLARVAFRRSPPRGENFKFSLPFSEEGGGHTAIEQSHSSSSSISRPSRCSCSWFHRAPGSPQQQQQTRCRRAPSLRALGKVLATYRSMQSYILHFGWTA